MRSVLRRFSAIGAFAVVAATLTVMSGAASASEAPGAAAIAAATSGGACTWGGQFGNGGKNADATDTDASYWATTYVAAPGEAMTFQGTFPLARYMSFTLYGLNGYPVAGGHLYDAEIQPTTGVNPFQSGQTGTGTYTLHVINGTPPATPAPNTLYTGTASPLADLQIIYRVYDPDPQAGPAGGVPLPNSTITLGGRVAATHQPCVSPYSLPLLGRLASGGTPDRSGARVASPETARRLGQPRVSRRRPISGSRRVARRVIDRSPARRAAAIAEPTWVGGDAIFYNPDNSYLGASISQAGGQLVVIQAQVPTFPDTNTGDVPWDSAAQVRYWSFCENDGIIPQVVACSADYDSVQSGGIATFVISTPANRPANATTADGVNWIPWGSSSRALIYYRQMLASSSFTQAIADVPAGNAPEVTMGAYYPAIAYCSDAEFAAAGAAGCLSS